MQAIAASITLFHALTTVIFSRSARRQILQTRWRNPAVLIGLARSRCLV